MIEVQQNTTWTSSDFPKGQLVLATNETETIVVFPNVHLKLLGGGQLENAFQVYFASPDASIQLHTGASIELVNVVFVGIGSKSNTDSISFSSSSSNIDVPVGKGIETISQSKTDYQDQITVRAIRWQCVGLVRCVNVPPATIDVTESTFSSRTNKDDYDDKDHVAVTCLGGRIMDSVFSNGAAIRAGREWYGTLDIISSTFQGTFGSTNTIGVVCSDHSSCTITNCTFMNYYGDFVADDLLDRSKPIRYDGIDRGYYHHAGMALVGHNGSPAGGRCQVKDSIFIGNRIAVDGCTVDQSYFDYNSISVSLGTSLTRSIIKHTVVGAVSVLHLDDVALCHNLLALWSYRSITNQNHDCNVTFLDNVVAIKSTYGINIGPPVNFIQSHLYDVHYAGSSSLDLTKAYFSDKDPKIRDGSTTGGEEDASSGPGLVLTSNDVTEPFVHPTYPLGATDCVIPSDLSTQGVNQILANDSLKQQMEKRLANLLDFGVVEVQDKRFVRLPEEWMPDDDNDNDDEHNVSGLWMETLVGKAAVVATVQQSSSHLPPPPSSPPVSCDDPNQEWTMVQVQKHTCAWLQQQQQQEHLNYYCQWARKACPQTCSGGVDKDHDACPPSLSQAVLSTSPPKCPRSTGGITLPMSAVVGLACYFIGLHLFLYRQWRQRQTRKRATMGSEFDNHDEQARSLAHEIELN